MNQTTAPFPSNPVSQQDQFTWGSFLMGALVTLGLFLILMLLLIWVMMLLPSARRADGVRYEQLAYTLEGRPVIAQTLDNGQSRYFDLQMRPLEIQSFEASRRLVYLENEWPRDFLFDGSKYQVVTFGMSEDPANFWYFLQGTDKPKFGYFEAVHPLTKRVTGYFGKNGWQLTRPGIENQFDLSNGRIFWVPHGYNAFYQSGKQPYINSATKMNLSVIFVLDGIAHLVNLNHRTIKQLSPTKEVISATPIYRTVTRESQGSTYADMESTSQYALRTADRILVVDSDAGSEQIWNLTDPHLKEAGAFLFLSENEMLAEHIRTEQIPDRGYPSVIYPRDLMWFNPAGEITQTETVTLQDYNQTARIIMLFQIGGILTGAPLAPVLMNFLFMPLGHMRADISYWAALKLVLPYAWPYLLISVVTGGVAIYFARRFAHKHHQRLHPAWGVLIALFGLTAYLGYRWHRSWPLAVLPDAPQPNGTEILVPV